MKLDHLSDLEILSNLNVVIGSRRQVTAELVAYIGEVEARQLELKEAYSSMYDFCCRKLRLSEGSAHRHIVGARTARRFPFVLELLRDGRIHLTALAMLSKYLTVENHVELLGRACEKSKAEIELLVRSRFPRPDVPDAIHPLVTQTGLADGSNGARRDSDAGPPSAHELRPSEARARVSALSADRFHIQFSAGSALKDKLERALDLMSHQNPKRDLAAVIERSLDLLLVDLEKKKLGKIDRPRRSRAAKHGDISRQARREVYERDGEQCTYVSKSGQRCRGRAFLQLDHRTPRACGGSGTADNARVMCRPHNLFLAQQAFGKEYVERRIRLRQRRLECESGRAAEDSVVGGGDTMGIADTASGATDVASSMVANGADCIDVGKHADSEPLEPTEALKPAECEPLNPAEPLNAAESGRFDPTEREPRNRIESAPREVDSMLLSALTMMGFRRAESQKAVAALGTNRATFGNAAQGSAPFDGLLRQALSVLVR